MVGRFVDFNCDQSHKVSIIGDSVVRGVGDLAHDNIGGYPFRLNRRTPESLVMSFGVPGITTKEFRRKLARDLRDTESLLYQTLIDSDLVIIDIGRNDFWIPYTPVRTVTNIRRIVSLLRRRFDEMGEVQPMIVVATLLPTSRGFQRDFIEGVTDLMLQSASEKLPVEIYMHTLNPAILSTDGIHPESKGYNKIARFVRRWLINTSIGLALSFRPDIDIDKIYDYFESTRYFGTDPTLFDTDGDSFGDGEELFELSRDPLDSLG